MKKTTINAILLSIITLMSVSICFLIFCIVTRPRYVTVNEQETAATITEVTDLSEAPPQQSEPPVSDNNTQTPVEEPPADNTMHGKTSTRVTIRARHQRMRKCWVLSMRELPLISLRYRTTAGPKSSMKALRLISLQIS